MSDIFEEVDDEVRKDRFEALWKKYGTYAIAAAVLVVGATAANAWWRQHQVDVARDAGDAYAAALGQAFAGEPDAAIVQLRSVAEDGTPGYSALAQLQIAAVQQRNGDTAAAATTLRALSENGDAPRQLRNLALIKEALLTIETADPADLGKAHRDLPPR